MDKDVLELGLLLEQKGKNEAAAQLYRKYVSVSAQSEDADALQIFYGDKVYDAIVTAKDAAMYSVIAESAAKVWKRICSKGLPLAAEKTDETLAELLRRVKNHNLSGRRPSAAEDRYDFGKLYTFLSDGSSVRMEAGEGVLVLPLKDIVLGVKSGRISLRSSAEAGTPSGKHYVVI